MAITNIAVTQTGLPNQSGKGTVTIIRATYPASTANASMVVGNISSYDIVSVAPIQAVTGYKGLIEIKGSRSASSQGQGTITVGNIDGGTGGSSTVDFEVRIYRN